MKQPSTINKGTVMIAVLILFAGSSVGASIEEFAAPTYAEEDPYLGAVDDTTDEKDWRALDSNNKGAKNFFSKIMPNRMDDRLDDRISHLEERIEIGQEIVIAYQFCIDQEDCEVDATVLEEMINNLNTKHSDMQEKINSNELLEEEVARFTEREDNEMGDEEENAPEDTSDDDSGQEECEEAGGTWSEDRRVCYEEDERLCIWEDEDGVVHYGCEDDNREVRFDCRTEEIWSDEKQKWCDLDRKKAFSDDKAILLESGRIAISFCIVSEDCTADQEKLREVLAHMSQRHENHRDCTDEERCEFGVQDKKGLFDRLHDTIRKDKRDAKTLSAPNMDVGEDACNERGGEWIEVDDRDKYFAFCNFWTPHDDSSQVECEEEGGTWSEERKTCYHEYHEDDDSMKEDSNREE